MAYVLRVAMGGLAVVMERPAGPGGVVSGGSVRGQVRGYSRASRLRLERHLRSQDWRPIVKCGHFVTLTTPPMARSGIREASRRLADQFAAAGYWGTWRREVHQAGGDHMHWLLVSPDEGDNPATAVRHLWARYWRRDFVTDSRPVETEARLAGYLCKELAKTRQASVAGGRWWGAFGRRHCRVEPLVLHVDCETWYRLHEWEAQYRASMPGGSRIWCYEPPGRWEEWLTRVGDDLV